MELPNSTSKDKLPRSRELAAKVIFAALQILKEKGGQAPGRDVVAEVERRVALDEWARATYEKSGYVRWQSRAIRDIDAN
jgi:restriction system protein